MSIAGRLSATTSLPLGQLTLLHGSWLSTANPSLTTYQCYRQQWGAVRPFKRQQVTERIDFFPSRLPVGPRPSAADPKALRRAEQAIIAMSFNRSINMASADRSSESPASDRLIQTGMLLPGFSSAPELRIDGFSLDGLDIRIVGAVDRVNGAGALSWDDGIPDCVLLDRRHELARYYRVPLHDRHPLLPLKRLIESQRQLSGIHRTTTFRFASVTNQVAPFVRPAPVVQPKGNTDYRLKIWAIETDDVDRFGEPVMLLQYLLFTQTRVVMQEADTLFPTLSAGSLIRSDQVA